MISEKNVDLGKLTEAGKFTFLDPLPLIPAIEKTANLQAVYDALTPLLTAHTLLIITDLAALEWIGIAPIALTRFIRAIRSLASRVCVHTFKMKSQYLIATGTDGVDSLISPPPFATGN